MKHTTQKPSNPIAKFWFFLSFSWVIKPISAFRKNIDLPIDELYFPDENHADHAHELFEEQWAKTLKSTHKGQKNRLMKALRSMYGGYYMLGGVCKLLWSALVICGAFFFVRSLLLHVDEDETGHAFDESWTGWALAGGFFGASVLWGLALQRMGYICMNTGVKVRSVLLTAVTRKAIYLSKVSVETSADIVNFVANDIGKVYDGLQEFHYLWAAPLEAGTILALLATKVDQWMLPALGIVAAVMFSQYFFGYQIAVNKMKASHWVNERGSILQEVLPSIKLVKYYGWEQYFEDKITAIRKLEERMAVTNNSYKTLNLCLVFTVPPACAWVLFTCYEFEVARLTSTIAFTSLTLFNILRFPLVVLPKALRAASEAAASLTRIENFLIESAEHEEKQHDRTGHGVDISKATFQFPGHEDFKLRIPELHVKEGEVLAVVGRVGSGKTALLHALLGNMPCHEGMCRIGGKIAYVPQTAWIQNQSIKDNIMFGQGRNERHYQSVLHACALEQDLEILPQGDESMGGLRGMNLSGGQRQRVNIARAAYFDADTVLLDNALSAVDLHTADHIFSECIEGLFRDKAVVLVTHQLQFIRRCPKVAIVDGGDLKYFGPFNAEAQRIMAQYLPVPDEDVVHHEAPKKVVKGGAAKVVKPEPKAITALPMGQSTLRFLRAGPMWKFVVAWTLGLFSQSSRQMSDFWIRGWSSDREEWYKSDDEHGEYASTMYAFIYGGLAFAFFAIQIARTGMFFYWGACASNQMHAKKLHRVLNAPLGFFLAKPVGELLSTFSSDQDKTDESLPDVLHLAGVYAIILLSTAITVSINLPEFVVFAFLLIVMTAVMLRVYLPSARAIKKMRLDTAGSLVGLTAEVLEGLPLVQAYSKEEHFVHEFTRQTDQHHRTLFTADSLNLWVSFYCDFYGAVMLAAVCLFAVSQKSRGSAVVGLAFSNTIQLLVFYTWTLRLVTEAISLSASVEQLTWLSYLAPIDGRDDINNAGQPLVTNVSWKELKHVTVGDEKAVANYPASGAISFENVKMRYRPTAGLALNGVNLDIRHCEKVGIVGRTGSGKSTLLMALYRMFDVMEGRITVGGVDIATLPLQQQRRGLAIIPQEPVMFTGTVRDNLDPLGHHTDRELSDIMRTVGLAAQTSEAGGLDGHVNGFGSDSWSVGQMQLVCLARAALNNVPVVCMDEATAALDPHTEHVVLEVAKKLFAQRTVLTIAHRLDAVIEADTVVVMEAGKVAETGPCSVLLNNPDSWFSHLVDATGPVEAAILRATAARLFAAAGGAPPAGYDDGARRL